MKGKKCVYGGLRGGEYNDSWLAVTVMYHCSHIRTRFTFPIPVFIIFYISLYIPNPPFIYTSSLFFIYISLSFEVKPIKLHIFSQDTFFVPVIYGFGTMMHIGNKVKLFTCSLRYRVVRKNRDNFLLSFLLFFFFSLP